MFCYFVLPVSYHSCCWCYFYLGVISYLPQPLVGFKNSLSHTAHVFCFFRCVLLWPTVLATQGESRPTIQKTSRCLLDWRIPIKTWVDYEKCIVPEKNLLLYQTKDQIQQANLYMPYPVRYGGKKGTIVRHFNVCCFFVDPARRSCFVPNRIQASCGQPLTDEIDESVVHWWLRSLPKHTTWIQRVTTFCVHHSFSLLESLWVVHTRIVSSEPDKTAVYAGWLWCSSPSCAPSWAARVAMAVFQTEGMI